MGGTMRTYTWNEFLAQGGDKQALWVGQRLAFFWLVVLSRSAIRPAFMAESTTSRSLSASTRGAIRFSVEVRSEGRLTRRQSSLRVLATGGKDATALFESMHPNSAVRDLLPKFKIGEIDVSTVPQNQVSLATFAAR